MSRVVPQLRSQALLLTSAVLIASIAAVAVARALGRRRSRLASTRPPGGHPCHPQYLVSGEQPLLVLSFGSLCFTARSLGLAGCRTFAAPFDWLYSNPRIVAHVISSGGATLLDGDEYTKAPADGVSSTCHRTYSPLLAKTQCKQNKHAVIFTHHDPTQAEDHAYMARTVERLRAALASALPKLCVLVSLERRGKLLDSDLDHLLETLAAHSNPAAPVTLVAVKLTTTEAAGGASTAGAGLAEATQRTRQLRHCALRVVEIRCRGGLGPKALGLTDKDDRRDLLVAIFGPDATFDECTKDGPDMLTHPALAADPLSSAEDLCCAGKALAGRTKALRQLWCRGHAGTHAKYREDRYMVERLGVLGRNG
eukprot:scaffold89175_cov55-Phaeocystis_antarctica.AAC.4